MSEAIFSCHWELLLAANDAAKHPIVHRTPPTTKSMVLKLRNPALKQQLFSFYEKSASGGKVEGKYSTTEMSTITFHEDENILYLCCPIQ